MYDRTGLSTKCTLINIYLFRPSDPNSDLLLRPYMKGILNFFNKSNLQDMMVNGASMLFYSSELFSNLACRVVALDEILAARLNFDPFVR